MFQTLADNEGTAHNASVNSQEAPGATIEVNTSSDMDIISERLTEALAKYAHDAWAAWMQYLFSKCTPGADDTLIIPTWAVARWQRQLNTDYALLSENEQELDKVEARRILTIMESQCAHFYNG